MRFGIPQEHVLWLRDQFGLRTFVETGTNEAASAVWASGHFERVVTIEGYEPLYRRAIERYGDVQNLRFVFGDSGECLASEVAQLSSPALFWLDAHWCGLETHGLSHECPVADELRAIDSSTCEHFILIDDARLFLAPPPAPHKAAHWPDITTIAQMLGSNGRGRYTAVFEDVIYSVPAFAKDLMVERLQRLAADVSALPLRPEPTVKSRLRRRLGALTGRALDRSDT